MITGGVLSSTAIVRLQLEEFPQASVAVQVRVTEYSCGQSPGVVESEKVMVGLASQASVAVAAPKFGVAGHSIGVLTVGQLITGGVVSTTQMVRLQVDELPQSSVAVQVRVTQYSAGQSPGTVTSAKVMVGLASQASVAVAAPKFGVAGHSMGEVTVGQLITGGVVSTTFAVRLHDVPGSGQLPQMMVAVTA